MRRRAALLGLAALPTALLAGCAVNDQMGAELAAQPVRVVFFEDDSVRLGEAALNVVQDAARVAAQYPNAPIRVLGFVAPDPNAAPISSLARARAEAVANELARMGVARGRIQVQGRGPAQLAAAEFPLQARRVEIHIGG